jgi:hypothetical protein
MVGAVALQAPAAASLLVVNCINGPYRTRRWYFCCLPDIGAEALPTRRQSGQFAPVLPCKPYVGRHRVAATATAAVPMAQQQLRLMLSLTAKQWPIPP